MTPSPEARRPQHLLPLPRWLCAAALLGAVAACERVPAEDLPESAGTTRAAVTAVPAMPPAGDAPQVYLRAPADGSTVPETFDVTFGLRNYGVAPAGVELSGTGHLHLLIDVPVPAAGTVIPADSAHRHYGMGQIEATLTLPPGEHTLIAVVGDHAHRVIDSLASNPVRVMVRRQP